MLKKRKCLLMVTCALLTLPGFSQQPDCNVEIDGGVSLERPVPEYGRYAISFSKRNETFLNSNYSQAIQNEVIEQGSLSLDMSFSHRIFYPLAWEVTGFYTSYKTPPLAGDDDTHVGHVGVEFFADVFPLPYIGRISDYFAPYVGIGYQTSSLYLGESISAGTGSAMFKTGTRLCLSNVFLLVEYKQTLPTNSNRLFRSFNFGIGFNF